MIPFLRNSFRNQRPRKPQGYETENYCCCLPWQRLHLPRVLSDIWFPKSQIRNIIVVVCPGSDYFCRESFLISQQFSVSFPCGSLGLWSEKYFSGKHHKNYECCPGNSLTVTNPQGHDQSWYGLLKTQYYVNLHWFWREITVGKKLANSNRHPQKNWAMPERKVVFFSVQASPTEQEWPGTLRLSLMETSSRKKWKQLQAEFKVSQFIWNSQLWH